MLTEQPCCAVAVGIHLIHKRVSILTETRRENAEFVVATHRFQKLVYAWPSLDVNVADVIVDVHRDHVIRVLYLVELTVHKGLVKIEDQSLHASVGIWLGTQEVVLVFWPALPRWHLSPLCLRPLAVAIVHWTGIQLTLGHLSHHGAEFSLDF